MVNNNLNRHKSFQIFLLNASPTVSVKDEGSLFDKVSPVYTLSFSIHIQSLVSGALVVTFSLNTLTHKGPPRFGDGFEGLRSFLFSTNNSFERLGSTIRL